MRNSYEKAPAQTSQKPRILSLSARERERVGVREVELEIKNSSSPWPLLHFSTEERRKIRLRLCRAHPSKKTER
jgi:hypothetical protein